MNPAFIHPAIRSLRLEMRDWSLGRLAADMRRRPLPPTFVAADAAQLALDVKQSGDFPSEPSAIRNRLRLWASGQKWDLALEASHLLGWREQAQTGCDADPSFLNIASALGPLALARALLPGAGIQALSDALACACSAGRLDQAEQLLAAGAKPDSGQWQGQSALWWSMARSGPCMSLLLSAGASWEVHDAHDDSPHGSGSNPLLVCARAMNYESLILALPHSPAHGRDGLGRTALMLCASPSPEWSLGFPSFDPQVPAALLAAGADPQARDNIGFSAIERAAFFGARRLFELLLPLVDLDEPTPLGGFLDDFVDAWGRKDSRAVEFPEDCDLEPPATRMALVLFCAREKQYIAAAAPSSPPSSGLYRRQSL